MEGRRRAALVCEGRVWMRDGRKADSGMTPPTTLPLSLFALDETIVGTEVTHPHTHIRHGCVCGGGGGSRGIDTHDWFKYFPTIEYTPREGRAGYSPPPPPLHTPQQQQYNHHRYGNSTHICKHTRVCRQRPPPPTAADSITQLGREGNTTPIS
jgi:hypothetical protein